MRLLNRLKNTKKAEGFVFSSMDKWFMGHPCRFSMKWLNELIEEHQKGLSFFSSLWSFMFLPYVTTFLCTTPLFDEGFSLRFTRRMKNTTFFYWTYGLDFDLLLWLKRPPIWGLDGGSTVHEFIDVAWINNLNSVTLRWSAY